LVWDHWRKTKRERRAIGNVTALAAVEPVVYPTQDVDVRYLIAPLPPRLREPFLLHYYGGFGIREIANLLRKPGEPSRPTCSRAGRQHRRRHLPALTSRPRPRPAGKPRRG